jgi:hypothetical protein
MRSSFVLAVGCATAASAWPLYGLGEAIDLDILAPAHMLVAATNSSTNITIASCGDATACNNNVTLSFRPLQVKSVETSLAGLAAILVALTYGLLTVYSPHLVTGLCIPRDILSVNVQEILKQLWPRTIDRNVINLSYLVYVDDSHEPGVGKDGQLGFYDLARHGQKFRQMLQANPFSPTQGYEKRGSLIRGFEEVSQTRLSVPEEMNPTVWIQTASSAMRNVIQLVIWEWVSLWLVVIMIFNTMLYNGVIGGSSPTNDRYPRLALISIYSLLYMFHFSATWYVFLRVFTLVTLQASWAVCFRLPFALGSVLPVVGDYSGRDDDGRDLRKAESKLTFDRFDIEVLGEVAISERYENAYAIDEHQVYLPRTDFLKHPRYVEQIETFAAMVGTNRIFRKMDKIPDDAKVDNNLKSMQEAEVKAFEKVTEVALERVVFNMAIIMSICITTGFAVWTRSPLNDTTSTQIGSYALLASTGTAFAAIISSASQLSSMLNSAKEILRLTEVALHKLVSHDESKKFYSYQQPLFGFAGEVAGRDRFSGKSVVLGTVWRTNKSFYQKLLSIVFGPAIGLLPNHRDYTQPLTLKLQVLDRSFIYHSDDLATSWRYSRDQPTLVPIGKSKLQLNDEWEWLLMRNVELIGPQEIG